MKKDCLDLLDLIINKTTELQTSLGEKEANELTRIPSEGKWSAIMTVHHMILAETGSLAYCQKKLSFNPELEEVTEEQMKMETKVPYLLRSPKYKVEAPPGLGAESLDNTMTLDAVFAKWKTLRAQIRSFIETQPDEMFSKALYKHPLGGKMRLIGMMMFFDGHFDSHAAQIKGNFDLMIA